MASIQIGVIDPQQSEKLNMQVPDDVEVRRLVDAIVEEMNLHTSQPIRYRLHLRRTNGQLIRLDETRTLTQNGVLQDAVLQMTAEMEATGSLERVLMRFTVHEYAGASSILMGVLPDLSIRAVSKLAIEALNLPEIDASGTIIRYRLKLRLGDGSLTELQEEKSLLENSLRVKDALVLVPDSVSQQHSWKSDNFEKSSSKNKQPFSFPNQQEWLYEDFDIMIRPSGDKYTATVLASPAGEATEEFQAPHPLAIENFILRIGHLRHGVRSVDSPQKEAALKFGKDLFQQLFQGRLLACLSASLQVVERQQRGLRIKLRLDEATDLMGIPWEFLYDPDRRKFLASQEDTPIIRFVSSVAARPHIPLELPLRVLMMASSPPDLPSLQVGEEKRKVQESLQPLMEGGLVAVEWVDGSSLSALNKHLVFSPTSYHVFHFIGHGGFDDRTGQGFLAMEGPSGRSEEITGDRLAPLLQAGKRRFGVVVLNACEGARNGRVDPFAGVATSLVRACNLPAVVAMQFEITDRAAITFSGHFYGALATGRPVDAAVTSARLAIWSEQNDVEWATPVLYLRSADGRIFDLTANPGGNGHSKNP